MGTPTPVDIRSWRGINFREAPNVIADDELASCINFNIGRSGELIKRGGVARLHFGEDLGSNTVTLLGHFKTDSVSYLVAAAGNQVWYSEDGITWTFLVAANAEFGIQYVNKYYIIRNNGLIIEWDPSNTTEMLFFEERDFEIDSVEGWTAVSGITAFATSTDEAFSGTRSLKITAAAATAITRSRLFSASDEYEVTVVLQARSTVSRTVRTQIQYLDSGLSVLASTNQDLASATGSWQQHTVSASAPANTAFFRVNVEYQSAAAGNILYLDNISIRLSAGVPRLIDGSPSGTAAIVFKDRLFVINSGGLGGVNSRLYFSEPADFGDWPSVNFIDVQPGEGDFLTALAIIQDVLIVFKTESIWGLYVQGAPEGWNLRVMSPEIGCVSKFTPEEIEGFLYFVGRRGVYRTDGNAFEDISETINSIFEDRVVNLSTSNKDSASWWKDRYVLLFYPTPATIRYLVFHLRAGGWTEWTFPAEVAPTSFLEITTDSPEPGLYAGDSLASGKVFRFGEDTFLDEGVSFQCSMKTKDFDFGSTATLKRIQWVALEHQGEGDITFNNYAQQVIRNTDDEAGVVGKVVTKMKGAEYVRSWQGEVVHEGAFPFTFFGFTAIVVPKRSIVHSGVM